MKNFNKVEKLRHLICIAILALVASCSSTNKKNTTSESRGQNFSNFDIKKFPNEYPVIANMISVLEPRMDEYERNLIASQISKAVEKYKVPPQIIVSIIDTESDFRHETISSTGDLSIAQINVDVWNKEFKRMSRPIIDKDRLIKDRAYSILRMGEILAILKKRHEKEDRRWYARYHSNTVHHKKDYLNKLESRLKLLAYSKKLKDSALAYNSLETSTSLKSKVVRR